MLQIKYIKLTHIGPTVSRTEPAPKPSVAPPAAWLPAFFVGPLPMNTSTRLFRTVLINRSASLTFIVTGTMCQRWGSGG